MAIFVLDDFLVVRPAGKIDWAVLQQLYREVQEIERDHPLSKRVVLTEAVEAVSITANDIILHKMSMPDPPLPVQTAFVVTTDFQYGIARMFQAVLETEKICIGIFRCLESAGQWLKSDLQPLAEYGMAGLSPAPASIGDPAGTSSPTVPQ